MADAIVDKLNTGFKDALLNNVKVTIKATAEASVATVTATTGFEVSGTLAQVTGVAGAGDPVITAQDISLKPPLLPAVNIPSSVVVNALKPVLVTPLKTALGTPLDALLNQITAPGGPITTIVKGVTDPILAAVEPVFMAFQQAARLIINDQPTLEGRPADIASPKAYTVRALTAVLFPGGLPGGGTPFAQVPDPRDGLARVSISSSTVFADAAAAAPTITAAPASVQDGKSTSVTGEGFDPAGGPVSVQLNDADGQPVAIRFR